MKSILIFVFIILFIQVSGQVIYTDYMPDVKMDYGNSFPTATSEFFFDLNKDSVNDFKIRFYLEYAPLSVQIISLNETAFVGYINQSYADTLSVNDTIDSTKVWKTTVLLVSDYSSGLWLNVKNKFIGVRLKNGNSYNYGWIRFRNYKTVCDYAINYDLNNDIKAGEGLPYRAELLTISDIGNYKDGRDIKISFEKAINESLISGYRIIAVKSAEADSFNIDSANSVLASNYIEVPAIALNYDTSYGSGTRDFNGDTIMEFLAYKVFVLSVANGIDTNINALSFPSNELILTSPAEAVSGLAVSDSYAGGSHYNIQVLFNKINNEQLINSYKIIFVKATEAAGFNLNSANNVEQGNYYIIMPNGNNYSLQLLSDSLKDKNGDTLLHEVDYYAFVVTNSDGINTNVNALSLKSNILNMSTSVKSAKYIIAEDVGASANGNDLQLSFNKASDENGISEYRVIAVKLSDTTLFDVVKAKNIQTGNYIQVLPGGNNVIINFGNGGKDKDGDLIKEHEAYKVYVLSVADMIQADIDILSKASNIITLSTPNYLKAGQTTGANIVYTNIEPDSSYSAFRSTEYYYLDLNNDSIIDFNVICTHNSSPMFSSGNSTIEPLNENSVSIIQASTSPDTISLNCMINNDLDWRKGICYMGSYYNDGPPGGDYSSSIWSGLENKYMGLQLIVGIDTLYGWLGIKAGYSNFTIRDYAYSNNIQALNAEISNTTNVSCNGYNDGSASVEVVGGVAPYSYLWSNGGASASLSNLSAGVYEVTVTDLVGNSIISSAEILQPTVLDLSLSVINFNVYTTTSGGTEPYTYLWSNSDSTENLINVNAGEYFITVTDSNGCQITRNINVTNVTSVENRIFNLYPNPSTDYIIIHLPVSEPLDKFEIKIYNSIGECLKSEKLNIDGIINISILNSGLYYLQLSNKVNRYKAFFVKE